MIRLQPYEKLGGANHGWLDTRQHFSFADHQDPERVYWGRLRVWNDDWIAPNTGFDPHPDGKLNLVPAPPRESWRCDLRLLGKSAVRSVAFLVGAAVVANAQQYRPAADPQHSVLPLAYPAPAARVPPPASWYYDPYTNGSTTCPQGGENLEPKCNVLIPPSNR